MTLPASLIDAIDEYCEQAHMLRATYIEYTLASSLKSAKELTASLAESMSGFVGSGE